MINQQQFICDSLEQGTYSLLFMSDIRLYIMSSE